MALTNLERWAVAKQKLTYALRQEWAKKLKESGFDDLERLARDNEDCYQNLIRPESVTTTLSVNEAADKVEYFAKALDFLNEHFWGSSKIGKFHFQIWQLHCEGATIAETARLLKRDRETIRFVINKLKVKMVSHETQS